MTPEGFGEPRRGAPMHRDALLVLEDGTAFRGEAFTTSPATVAAWAVNASPAKAAPSSNTSSAS